MGLRLLVPLCSVAMIAAAIVFRVRLWANIPGLIVFFAGLLRTGARDANAGCSSKSYWGNAMGFECK